MSEQDDLRTSYLIELGPYIGLSLLSFYTCFAVELYNGIPEIVAGVNEVRDLEKTVAYGAVPYAAYGMLRAWGSYSDIMGRLGYNVNKDDPLGCSLFGTAALVAPCLVGDKGADFGRYVVQNASQFAELFSNYM